MTVCIDPPARPGHGRLWSHLVGDVSYGELHLFAEELGIPSRAFERDLPQVPGCARTGAPIDIPAHRYAEVVAAGAVEVGSREVVRLLRGAGPRRRKVSSPGASTPQSR